MKALAALLVAVLVADIASVTTHHDTHTHPAYRPVAVVARGAYALHVRDVERASRSAIRQPLRHHHKTRRVSVDAQRATAGRLPSTSPSDPQRYALSLVGPAQFACLDPMWERESHWNPYARNPSGAYGIAQLMPGTWESLGLAPSSDPRRQVDAGLAYIHERYGSPCGAWAFWQSNGWY